MMSAAVLLRCGYDFFRDISISAVIAKESYQYYKCMREIIRGEDQGHVHIRRDKAGGQKADSGRL